LRYLPNGRWKGTRLMHVQIANSHDVTLISSSPWFGNAVAINTYSLKVHQGIAERSWSLSAASNNESHQG
jgi:hypothetical protein